MKKLLLIALITPCAVLLIGCPKDEVSSQATAAPAGQEMAAAPADDMSASTMHAAVATIPTKLGDEAYPLTGLNWIKGDPVAISPGKVYVVEFWATWCPPCRESIPHLTQLQAKYKDRVTFVGVSQEDPGVVKPFVSDKGDKMAYTVAVDTAGKVGKGYMTAFQQGGIPTAFVVDAKGKVVWYGHPLGDLESVLGQVLAGTYSVPG